jgi:adenylate kinase
MNDNLSLRIYITGTPGTGKTSIAKCLSKKLNLDFLEVNDLIIKEGLYLGYDINRDTLIVDDEKLSKRLTHKLNSVDKICVAGGTIIESLPIDFIIILHVPIPSLRRRLEKREYSQEKIESNLESEIMNVLFYEISESYPSEIIHEILNDNSNIETACEEIVSIIREHHLRVTK